MICKDGEYIPEVGDKVYFTSCTDTLERSCIDKRLAGKKADVVERHDNDNIVVLHSNDVEVSCKWLEHVYPSLPEVGQRCISSSEEMMRLVSMPPSIYSNRECTIMSNHSSLLKYGWVSVSFSEYDFDWRMLWYKTIFPIEDKNVTGIRCPICSSLGYVGFTSFKCDNKNCRNH